MRKILGEFIPLLTLLRAWLWPNARRPVSYRRQHRYTRRTPIGQYAREICYRYRMEHPTAGVFGTYSGALSQVG